MVLYFLPVVKGKGGSFFTKSPEKWQNFQWNHPSSGEKTAWLPPFAKKTLQNLLTRTLGNAMLNIPSKLGEMGRRPL